MDFEKSIRFFVYIEKPKTMAAGLAIFTSWFIGRIFFIVETLA